jgi:hypothetical protein
VVRWALPALIAAVIGGTVWGSFELKGLLNELQNSRKTAQDALVTFDKNLNEQATSLLSLEKAKAEAIGASAARALPGYYEEQKALFLKTQAETGNQLLKARVDAILIDFEDRKKETEKSAKALQDTIAALLSASGAPAQITQIRDALVQLDAEVGGLKSLKAEVSELRHTLDTASGGSRLSPLQLFTIFQIKDFLAVIALVIAILAAVFVALENHRARVGLTIVLGIFIATGVLGLLGLCVMLGMS